MKQQKDIIGEYEVIGLGITKSRLLDKGFSITDYINFFDILENSNCKGNNVMIEFIGYENENINLFQIQEIKSFFETIFYYKPHFFYFLSNEIKTIELAYLALATDEIENDISVLFRKIIEYTISYSRKQGDSIKEQLVIQKRISTAVSEGLMYRESLNFKKFKGVV